MGDGRGKHAKRRLPCAAGDLRLPGQEGQHRAFLLSKPLQHGASDTILVVEDGQWWTEARYD